MDEEYGEAFARILLRTVLGKPIRNVKIVPQKSIPGIDIDKHGIRLDAYIEEISDELNPHIADAEIIVKKTRLFLMTTMPPIRTLPLFKSL